MFYVQLANVNGQISRTEREKNADGHCQISRPQQLGEQGFEIGWMDATVEFEDQRFNRVKRIG